MRPVQSTDVYQQARVLQRPRREPWGFLSIFKILKPQENLSNLTCLVRVAVFQLPNWAVGGEGDFRWAEPGPMWPRKGFRRGFFTFFLRIFCFPKSLSSDLNLKRVISSPTRGGRGAISSIANPRDSLHADWYRERIEQIWCWFYRRTKLNCFKVTSWGNLFKSARAKVFQMRRRMCVRFNFMLG